MSPDPSLSRAGRRWRSAIGHDRHTPAHQAFQSPQAGRHQLFQAPHCLAHRWSPRAQAFSARAVAGVSAARKPNSPKAMSERFRIFPSGQWESHDKYGGADAKSKTKAIGEIVNSLVQQKFGAAAADYAASTVHAKGETIALLVELTKPQNHWRVLDVATGAGHTRRRPSESAEPRASVTSGRDGESS